MKHGIKSMLGNYKKSGEKVRLKKKPIDFLVKA